MKQITNTEYDNIVQKIYMAFMNFPKMGMGEMGDAREQAKIIVDEWMNEQGIELDESEVEQTQPLKEILKAEFTKFERMNNWVSGKIGNYNFEAKLFDEVSTFGINNGRVSKLSIWDEKIRKEKQDFLGACIVNYDRGWDIKPKKNIKPEYLAVMELLENAPKTRFN